MSKPFISISNNLIFKTMLPKIRFRLVFNYANRLNKNGQAPVDLEVRHGCRKKYISSKIMLHDNQWECGRVVNHDNADKLTTYLVRWKNEIEEIELDALLKHKHLSLYQLMEAIKSVVRTNATISDFIESAIAKNGKRCKSTISGYKFLASDIKERYGNITIDDITFDFIEKYRSDMRNSNLSENTIKARLKLLRCVVNEAIKRNLITDDHFKFITIGNMTARVGYLEKKEVDKLERLELKGKEAIVRDLFLFSCYTGLRWSGNWQAWTKVSTTVTT